MDIFQKIIEKPKMAEKFLVKPPPRYVFDIIMNTMNATGFPKGLFTEDETNVKYFEEVLIIFIDRIHKIKLKFSKKLLT